MNKNLGVSVYPHRSTPEACMNYINTAAALGYKRLFSCMLSLEGESGLKNFQAITLHAAEAGMEVFLDIAPSVFEVLGIDPGDLGFFKKLGAAGVRLDVGYDGIKESSLTHNPESLAVELNISYDTPYLNLIDAYGPRRSQLQGCHNFYPQIYTGLSLPHFMAASRRFKDLGLRTAAFGSCGGGVGPWLINDGLCTLEHHRFLPLTVQVQELWATGLIDDVIIGDAFASEQQLQATAALDRDVPSLAFEWEKGVSPIEKEIALAPTHFRRGDLNDYFIRSTNRRGEYAKVPLPARAYRGDQQAGDIFTGNDNFGNYKGELQICTAPCPADPRKNRIGRIRTQWMGLLKYIGAWGRFRLNDSQNLL